MFHPHVAKENFLARTKHSKSLDETTELVAWMVLLQTTNLVSIDVLVDHFRDALWELRHPLHKK